MIKFENYPCWQCKNLDDMGGCKLNDHINPVWLTEEETNRFKCFKYDKVSVSYRRVSEYIEQHCYTYSVEDVIKECERDSSKGLFTSCAMLDVIAHRQLELSILLKDRSTN